MKLCQTVGLALAALLAASPVAATAAEEGHAHGHSHDHGHSGDHAAASDPGHSAGPAPDAAEPVDGAILYHEYCSVCHGDRGNGDSRARGSMVPPPRDFTAPEARALSREAIVAAIAKGKPGTAMAPWETQLGEREIAAVADFVLEAFIAPIDSDSAGEGARIYARTCSVCHGDHGSGAVWATANLNPRPRNFTTTEAAAELGRKRMIHSVTYGRPDTAMPGFGTQLDEHQIEAVVDFVRRRFMRAGAVAAAAPQAAADEQAHGGHAAPGDGHTAQAHGEHGHAEAAASGAHDHDAHLGDAGAMAEPFPGGLVGSYARGEQLYRTNCVPCHGEQGNGQGPRAYFILPKPRNFTHPASRSSFNRPHLFQSVARGKLGSEMAAWDTVLDEQAIADVAEYVFQRFIVGNEPRASADAVHRH